MTGQTGTTFSPSKYVGSLGYYADGDSGLMLLQHRYYDPGAGRFITLDPIKDGVNWYAYCANDPVNGVDPRGLMPERGHCYDLFPPSITEGPDCPRNWHQHSEQTVPGTGGKCDFEIWGWQRCFYAWVTIGEHQGYVGMCEFLGGRNGAWVDCSTGHPYIHWVNWKPENPGLPEDQWVPKEYVHHIFDVHHKRLKIFCTDNYQDPYEEHRALHHDPCGDALPAHPWGPGVGPPGGPPSP